MWQQQEVLGRVPVLLSIYPVEDVRRTLGERRRDLMLLFPVSSPSSEAVPKSSCKTELKKTEMSQPLMSAGTQSILRYL